MAATPPGLVCLAPSQSTEALLWLTQESPFSILVYRHVPIVHLPITQLLARTNDIPILLTAETKIIGTMPVLQFLARQATCQRLFTGEKVDGAGFSTLLQKFAVTLSYYVGQWAYAYLLPEKSICLPMLTVGVPLWEYWAARLSYPLIAKLISDGFEIKPGVQASALEQINAISLGAMETMSDGRLYLTGNSLTAIDIVFATSLAPALLPTNYSGIAQPLEALPPAMAGEIRILRETTFGQYVRRVYKQNRPSLSA
jgi:glutathione S-transferase